MSTALRPTATDGTVAEAIRDAIATATAVRIVGAGTWLDAGQPVRAARTVSVAPHTGIVEYVPGDLTLTARAGTSLEEIADATRAHGQWLPLEPAGSPAGTLGATVATGSAGPLAHAFGTPRDLVLGLECVTGRGDVVRGGGRVTKNVAGFDLSRLFTGSWGTLGVLTEITVRLRARPQAEATLAMAVDDSPTRMGQRIRVLRAAAIDPMALELVNRPLATMLGVGDGPLLLVRLGGNADSLRAQRAVVFALGDTREVDPAIWDAVRAVEPAHSWVWRLSDLPSRIVETWQRAGSLVADLRRAWIHASVGRGVVRCIASPEPDTEEALAGAIARAPLGETTIVERATPGRWPARRSRAMADPISRRIRAAFDPHGILNPGILGEDVP